MTSFSPAQMAETLSLELTRAEGHLLVRRIDETLRIAPDPLRGLDLSTRSDRHVAFCILTAARLGLDRRASAFEPGAAADEPSRPLRYHEKPSIYGERLPRLLPTLAVSWFEAISQTEPFTSDWQLEHLVQVYVLETGKHLHTLAVCDVPKMAEDAEKIRRNGRHALFYDSYKLKPRQKERYSGGLVRIFRTVEGLGASRAVLLPDFDYDAAREGGSFAIPSRDTMLIGRPDEPEHADAIADAVAKLAEDEMESALFPLCNRVWRMTDKHIDTSVEFGSATLPSEHWQSFAPEQFDVDVSPSHSD